ncbi:MAG TPA: hypothetical protein VFJ24_00590 [Gaiellales bacterium]|nr:hypothetical protein [Gaiellales bacterium]
MSAALGDTPGATFAGSARSQARVSFTASPVGSCWVSVVVPVAADEDGTAAALAGDAGGPDDAEPPAWPHADAQTAVTPTTRAACATAFIGSSWG